MTRFLTCVIFAAFLMQVYVFRFYFDNDKHIFTVRLQDSVDIICPRYQQDYPKNKVEYSYLYLVSFWMLDFGAWGQHGVKKLDPSAFITVMKLQFFIFRSTGKVTRSAWLIQRSTVWLAFVQSRTNLKSSQLSFEYLHHRRKDWNSKLMKCIMSFVSNKILKFNFTTQFPLE